MIYLEVQSSKMKLSQLFQVSAQYASYIRITISLAVLVTEKNLKKIVKLFNFFGVSE